jgi:hypothetical protein
METRTLEGTEVNSFAPIAAVSLRRISGGGDAIASEEGPSTPASTMASGNEPGCYDRVFLGRTTR